MDTNELEYFDKKFDALDTKIEGAKAEVQVVRTALVEKIDKVCAEVREHSAQSNARLATIDKELALHEQARCPDVEKHEKDYHNIGKIIGVLVGIMTVASMGAAALIWFVGKVH